MAVDMFIQIGALKGEARDKTHKDKIDVLAWSWGMSNSGSAHIGGGAGAGKVNVQDLSFTKYIDRTSPTLLDYLATGNVIAKAKLTVVKAGETQAPYLRYCFTGLQVSSLSSGGSGGENRLTENVTLSYSTIVEAYQQQRADGTLAAPVFGGWDLIKNLQYGDPTC